MRALRLLLGAALLASLTAALPTSAADERRVVPTPTVTGPITGGVRGAPFMGLLQVPPGYVQEEWFFSGTATAYNCSSITLVPGAPTQPPRDCPEGVSPPPPAPYTSRMVVVRPRSPHLFDGTVVANWFNVSFAHDITTWYSIGEQVVREGMAYVDISAQVAADGTLKAYDPVRYAPIVHPGDAYSYDIYSQGIQALRSIAAGPMGPLTSERVLAMGASQSGFTLDQYLRLVEPEVQRVVDGFLVAVANGPDPKRPVPVLRFLSENEYRAGTSTSPDSRWYRQWDVAGAAHGNLASFQYLGAQEQRDLGVAVLPPLAGDNGPFGLSSCLVNRYPSHWAYNAALHHLKQWVVTGEAAPAAPRVAMRDGALVRDAASGNAVGGLRLPPVEVPTAAYNRGGDCVSLDGRTEPYSPAELKRRYPTKSVYVAKVRAAAERAVRAGWLLKPDAVAAVLAAHRSSVPAAAPL